MCQQRPDTRAGSERNRARELRPDDRPDNRRHRGEIQHGAHRPRGGCSGPSLYARILAYARRRRSRLTPTTWRDRWMWGTASMPGIWREKIPKIGQPNALVCAWLRRRSAEQSDRQAGIAQACLTIGRSSRTGQLAACPVGLKEESTSSNGGRTRTGRSTAPAHAMKPEAGGASICRTMWIGNQFSFTCLKTRTIS